MKNTFNKIILITGLLAFSFSLLSQQTYINKVWVNSTGSIGPIDRTVSALDNNENLITVSNTINASNNTDVLITKFDPEGNMLWQTTFDGSGNGNDYGIQVKINSSNDIFVACVLEGTSSSDFGILKYSSSGSLTWSNSWNGSNNGDDIPSDLDIDNSGNVYIVGGTESSNTFSDYAIVKFNAAGTFGWVSTYDYANLHDAATSVTFGNNKVNVTGASASSTTKWDYATLQLNASNGAVLNTERTVVPGVGFDKALDVTSDQNNNIYITGYVEGSGGLDIQTLKLNSNFSVEWVKIFDGGLEDIGKSIAVDNSGNVYVAGSMENGNGGKEYIVLKYDLSGNLVWEQPYGAAGSQIIASAEHLVLTSQGEPIITGTLDDLGAKIFATIKYSTDGKLNFEKIFDAGSQKNEAQSVISIDNEIYVTGVTEINGVNQISTVKYTLIDKPLNIVMVNGDPSHNQNELIIRFDESSIIHTAIDKIDFQAGVLSDFVKPSVLGELAAATETSWDNYPTFKIFRRMTTADTVSVNRLGETITIPAHWATLSVYVPASNDLDILASTIDAINPSINYADKNPVGVLLNAPNDALYSVQQTGLFNTSHGINVQQAWNVQVGSTNIKVGVYDSGINWSHEDFGDGTSTGTKIAGGWDYYTDVDPLSQNMPDGHGHGTATSSLIGALRNNNKGIAGIAGGDVQSGNTGCQLFDMAIPVDVSLFPNQVVSVLHSVAAPAIVEGAMDNPNTGFGFGLHVQNHSWGRTQSSKLLEDAVETCFRNNCAFVVSSGNDFNATINYPASYSDEMVIKVGANDISGNRASFSTYGNDLDFIAPGTNDQYMVLHNTTNTGYVDFFNGGGVINGTSFSAPHVSGAAALLLSEHNTSNGYPNNLAPEDIEKFLQDYATDITSTGIGYDQETGFGRINVASSLDHLTLPFYYIKHSSNNPTVLQTATASQQIVLPYKIMGLAAGNYWATRYQVTNTYLEVLPSGHSAQGFWKRYSSSVGYSAANPLTGKTYFSEQHTITQNVVSVTATTWCWYVHNSMSGQSINKYIPAPPSQLKAAFSIHVKDNLATGIEERESIKNVKIYPNPSKSNVMLEFSITEASNVIVEILDATGKKVITHNLGDKAYGNHSLELNLSNLSKGLYLVNLTVGSTIISKRLIKN